MTRTSDCVYQSTIDGFNALDDTHVVLYSMGQRKAYLAELEGACFDVKSQSTLAAIDGDQNGQICGFGRDAIAYRRMGMVENCRILGMQQLSDERRIELGVGAPPPKPKKAGQAEAGRKAGRNEVAAGPPHERAACGPARRLSKMTGMNRPVSAVPTAALQALKDILGPGGWLDADADREPFEIDFRRLHRGSDAARRTAGFDRARCRRSSSSARASASRSCRRAATPAIAAVRRRGRAATRSCCRSGACGRSARCPRRTTR